MAEVFANNPIGFLNASITNVATSLVLQAGQGANFPSSGIFHIIIDNEIITVGARSGDTLSSLTRNEFGGAAAHNSGAQVTQIMSAAAYGEFVQKNIVDAKGDLIAATAADSVARLAVGADATILTADSGQSTGVAWTGLWQTYTPAWTSTGTAPVMGNATFNAKFVQIGKTVIVVVHIAFGSTSTFGTGSWRFSLPVTYSTGGIPNSTAVFGDTSAAQFYGGFTRVQSSTTVEFLTGAQPGVAVTNLAPFTWANTDTIQWGIVYDAV